VTIIRFLIKYNEATKGMMTSDVKGITTKGKFCQEFYSCLRFSVGECFNFMWNT